MKFASRSSARPMPKLPTVSTIWYTSSSTACSGGAQAHGAEVRLGQPDRRQSEPAVQQREASPRGVLRRSAEEQTQYLGDRGATQYAAGSAGDRAQAGSG